MSNTAAALEWRLCGPRCLSSAFFSSRACACMCTACPSYGWGDGGNGQLCRPVTSGDTAGGFQPPKIMYGPRGLWDKMAASEDHTLLLSKGAGCFPRKCTYSAFPTVTP